ncbi:hypothetical protein HZB96_00910, partial [Candidatus Gottesmanbacteria bacterium]|nr:hypothetical protein [Candidatus Gottesmanbacteria bacterium]
MSLLKTILARLEEIEKQLQDKEGVNVKSSPQEVKEKVTVDERGVLSQAQQEAKAIILEARDEAFKLKKNAEEEASRIRQEVI